MSYLYNNAGVSLLYTGEPDEAIDYFEKEYNMHEKGLLKNLDLKQIY